MGSRKAWPSRLEVIDKDQARSLQQHSIENLEIEDQGRYGERFPKHAPNLEACNHSSWWGLHEKRCDDVVSIRHRMGKYRSEIEKPFSLTLAKEQKVSSHFGLALDTWQGRRDFGEIRANHEGLGRTGKTGSSMLQRVAFLGKG